MADLDRSYRQPYPWAGLVLLAFGAVTFLGAALVCVYGIAVADVGLAVFCAVVAVWVAGLWLVVLDGVADDWPPR